MKKKMTAILLTLFTGAFGGHQFYLGNTKRGIFYLLGTIFCITYPVVWVFVLLDLIKYIKCDEKEFDATFRFVPEAAAAE